MKIGKTVATAVGGSLILLQIASHKGYININWNKVNKDLEGASKKLAQSSSDPSIPQMLDKVRMGLLYTVLALYSSQVETRECNTCHSFDVQALPANELPVFPIFICCLFLSCYIHRFRLSS